MKMKRTADIRKIIDTDDTVLIQRVLDGHTEQFRPLADRHAHRVQKFVARMIPLSEDAEEVTQDTLVSAFKAWHVLMRRGRVSGLGCYVSPTTSR